MSAIGQKMKDEGDLTPLTLLKPQNETASAVRAPTLTGFPITIGQSLECYLRSREAVDMAHSAARESNGSLYVGVSRVVAEQESGLVHRHSRLLPARLRWPKVPNPDNRNQLPPAPLIRPYQRRNVRDTEAVPSSILIEEWEKFH